MGQMVCFIFTNVFAMTAGPQNQASTGSVFMYTLEGKFSLIKLLKLN